MTELSPEDRERVADALVRKADALLRVLRATAESDQPERIDDEAADLGKVLDAAGFPSERAAEFRTRIRSLVAQAHQRAVESCFNEAERRARLGDPKGRNDMLIKAKDHFAAALRNGAGDECRRIVERRIEVLMFTTKEGVDDRTRQAAERKLSVTETGALLPDGIEHRRARRYTDPVLTVTIDGVSYETINWSIRGVLLTPYRRDAGLAPGDRARLQLSCRRIDAGGRQAARVVRVDPKGRTIALGFPDISTVVLAILRGLKDLGVRPE